MTNNKNSIHLQDFPNLNFVENNDQLVRDMDLVRSICSSALAIRDNKNLRVRLPLNKLSVIGKDAARIIAYKDIIAEEVNVKNIEIEEDLENKAELKLAINFKKIGAKMGPKIKDIMAAVKSGQWQKINDNTISIAGETLSGDDYTLKLTPKEFDSCDIQTAALSDNSHLISIDTKITPELKNEGVARDIIRGIQQARKDADLDVSDKVDILLQCQNAEAENIVKHFKKYIKEQVLANTIEFNNEDDPPSDSKLFSSKIELGEIKIIFKQL